MRSPLASLLCVALLICLHGEGNGDTEHDKWEKDKTEKALVGVCQENKEAFNFQHITDVRSAKEKKEIGWFVKNLHEEKHLPIEWDIAGMPFRFIEKKGTRLVTMETTKKVDEIQSEIVYGATKQHNKKAASYDVKDDAKQAAELSNVGSGKGNFGMRLEGKLNSQLVGEDGKESLTIKFGFASFIEKKDDNYIFHYEIRNLSEFPYRVEMPALRIRVEELQKTIGVTSSKDLSDPRGLLQKPKELKDYTITVSLKTIPVSFFSERIEKVTIRKDVEGKGMEVERAAVSIYLPERR